MTQLALMPQMMAAEIERPTLTGARTCSDVAPGLLTLVVEREAGQPLLVETWIDVGETTSLELDGEVRWSASDPTTETLAGIVHADRCTFVPDACTSESRLAEVRRLEQVLASETASARERQLARLVLWRLTDTGDTQALARAIWDGLADAPLAAAGFWATTIEVALALGLEQGGELERMAGEASGVASAWPSFVRAGVLARLLMLAEERGDEASAARIRAVVLGDAELRATSFGARVALEAPIDPALVEQAGLLARTLIASHADQPCQTSARWLIYFHSSTCAACKPLNQRLQALLDSQPADLRIVTIATDGVASSLVAPERLAASPFAPELEAWFEQARGGPITPFLMHLQCDDSGALELVGLGHSEAAAGFEQP